MYIVYTSLLFDCFHPFVDELTKREREEFSEFIYAYLILVFLHIFLFNLCAFIEYLYVFTMHELKGSFYEAYL